MINIANGNVPEAGELSKDKKLSSITKNKSHITSVKSSSILMKRLLINDKTK